MIKNKTEVSERKVTSQTKFFQEKKPECNGIVQTTTVTVNIDQKEDCFSRFVSAITSCIKPPSKG